MRRGTVSGLLRIATREPRTGAPESLHYAGADRWVSMPNGARGSFSRGRSSVEAGPTPAPWRSAPFLLNTPPARQRIIHHHEPRLTAAVQQRRENEGRVCFRPSLHGLLIATGPGWPHPSCPETEIPGIRA